MDNKMVSIITVCLNSEKHITDTIESVLNQTYSNVEYIIIDGGSTDHTIDIVKGYEDLFKGKLKLISEPDEGIYYAMNKGLKLAKGAYVGIINSDDWYEKDGVAQVVDTFENTGCDIVYGIENVWKEDKLYRLEFISHEFLHEGMLPHPTCFVKNQVYKKHGGFNTDFKSTADYDMYMRFDSEGLIFQPVYAVIANFRYGGFSTQNKNFITSIDVLKVQNKYGVISKRYYNFKRFEYAVKGLFNGIKG